MSINLGPNYRRMVMLVLILVTILVAVATTLVGPVSFFGILVAMRESKIVAMGAPDDIMQPDCLRAIYDFDIRIEEINGKPIAIYYR